MLPLVGLPGLGHVNCYAIEDERGFALVDPGMMGPANWKRLRRRLDAAGIPLKRVHTVVVTHSHPDHFGGAGFLRRESGAEIVTARALPHLVRSGRGDASRTSTPPSSRRWRCPSVGQPWGGEAASSMPWRRRLRAQGARDAFPRADGHATAERPPLADAEADPARPAGVGGRAHARATPPTTSACTTRPRARCSPATTCCRRITPHISGLTGADPLLEFFNSLDKVAAFADTRTVLPAHGHPFPDLAGPRRRHQAPPRRAPRPACERHRPTSDGRRR